MNSLCQMTGPNRTGFYRWRVPRQATSVEMELRDQMQKVALESPTGTGHFHRTLRREISAIEMTIRVGHPDLPGLCLALSDWWGELRMIEQEMGLRATEAATAATGRAEQGFTLPE